MTNTKSKYRRILIRALTLVLFSIGAVAADSQENLRTQTKALERQAEKLRQKGRLAEAAELLRSGLRQEPKSASVKLALSYVLLQQRKFVEANELAVDVARTNPKNARAFALIGSAMLNSGNFEDSGVYLRNANILDDEEPLAWFSAGMSDFFENRTDQALEKLREAVRLEPNEPDFVFALAQVNARAENYKEAAEGYDRFLQIAPIVDRDRRDRIKGLRNFLRFLGAKNKLYRFDFGNKTSVLDFDLVSFRPVVEVTLGRKNKCRFVLDTGSGITVISQELAKRLNIRPVARGGKARAVGGDGTFDIVYGFLPSIKLGTAQVMNVPVYIREFRENYEQIEGYIGLSLISKFLTTVDYGEKKIYLSKKDAQSIQRTDNEGLGMNLRLTSSGFLSGEVQVGGINSSLNFILDTGASISVISEDLSLLTEIQPFISDEKMRVIGAAGITENVSTFLLPRVSIGSFSREHVKAIALDLDVINEASGFEQAGILGGNFLMNYRFTFDFQKSRVTFVPLNLPQNSELQQ